MNSSISVLIADSQYLACAGFEQLISEEKDLEMRGEPADGKELLEMAGEMSSGIVIFDYHRSEEFLPVDIRKVKEKYPEVYFLVVSADNNKDQVFQVISFGATSFLTKNCSREEILEAIHATAKGEKFFCNKVLDIILEKDQQGEDCSPTHLTGRETEVVGLIAEGLSTKDIAEKLCLSPHTIHTHRKNIMKKLGVNSTSQVLMYAVNAGIVG